MSLLPNEPRLADVETQARLTEQYLWPERQALYALLVSVRQALNSELSKACPTKQGKPYPLGQCLEITLALFKRLPNVDPAILAPDALRGLQALHRFVRYGGVVRQVWGDLRGDYFQNALLVGVLYVDVANDTVDLNKPPVEILPFAEARFAPIRDFHHFAQVARRYWQARVYPNHLIPSLAPYAPLISVTSSGLVQLQSATDYMLALSQADGFRSAEAVLQAPLMNASLFTLMHQCLSVLPITLASQPSAGQAEALAMCQTYRGLNEKKVHCRNEAVRTLLQVNARLAHLNVKAPASAGAG
jgi:hypothetical protein